MSTDLLLSHLKSVKSSIQPAENPDKSINKRKRAVKEVRDPCLCMLCTSLWVCDPYSNLPSPTTSQIDYAAQARTHLSQKKARIDHRILITTLAQPAKKNKKKLAKLVKRAKEVSKV